jgi:tetratricopeptide (TPR) repeat protein
MIWRSKTKQKELRLRKGVVLLSLLILCVALPVCRYGPRVYSRWEQHRLITQTRSLLAANDYARAILCLRRILELNPANLEASRLFAELADKVGRPEAVSFRERVCLLAPDSFDDAYAWAVSALKFGDLTRASEALKILKKTGENRAGYHEIAARIAVAERRPVEAHAEFSEALKLTPGDQMLQLQAAVLDIQSKNPAVREAARQALERLRRTPEQHIGALRALAVCYAGSGQIDRALQIARELMTSPGANFEDRLTYLSILQGTRNPGFTSYLTGLQESARNDPVQIAMLADWMNTHGLAMLNNDWLATLPPKTIATPPVAPKAAKAYILLADWKKLQTFTATPGWDDLEFMRLAFLSRALAENGDATGSDAQWKVAISMTADRPDRLEMLEKTAAEWNWDARLEDLLWFIADNSKHPQQALQLLATRYQRTGDTRKLYRAVTDLHNHDPTNVPLKNNWILLALLLNADTDRATQAAEELYNSNRSDPHVVATYAFSLYMADRTDDALAVMGTLSPEQLSEPTISAYYGMLLAALRKPDASKYLGHSKGAPLLPEEEQLVERAWESLDDKE